MPRYNVVLFAGLLLVSAGGCNKSASNAASSGTATTASAAAATSSATVARASLDTSSTTAAPKGDPDAIRFAIQQHLAGNSSLNMAAMDMNLTRISINGDQAQADVEFRLKQGGTTMQVAYSLMRHAGGWLVTSSHPGVGQFAHPPMDLNHSGAPGASQNPGSLGMPDVHDFFKNAPASQKQQ
jgi:hypothetical protein